MKYCKTCIQPDTRPSGGTFTNGICPACTFFFSDKKETLIKSEKIADFKEYISKHLIKKNGYNCVLGVSGGKDSTRQALFARDVLKLKPYLVCLAYPPELLTLIGANNLGNLNKLGFSVEVSTLAPQSWKKLMRYAFLKWGNPLIPTEQALYSSVPKIALEKGLKLILWGENPYLQLGDKNTMGSDEFDGDNLRFTNTLRFIEKPWVEDIICRYRAEGYKYPRNEIYSKNKLKTVFMGTIMDSWSELNNGEYAILQGLNIRNEKPEDIGENYGVTALDQNITPLNQMIKYLKFGFGRMTDYLNEEIRLGRVSRKEAILLAKKYDGKIADKYINDFCDYIEITKSEFWREVNKFVNKDLFDFKKEGEYLPKFKIGVGL